MQEWFNDLKAKVIAILQTREENKPNEETTDITFDSSNTEAATKGVSLSTRNIIIVAVIIGILFSVFKSCGNSSLVNETSDDGKVKANHWYYHRDLDIVNFKNCVVVQPTIMQSGNVMLTYYPVCAECHETSSTPSMGAPSQDNPLMKTYYCDCGGQTAVIIKIVP